MIYICKYCGKEFHNSGEHKSHELTCIKNPNREKNKSLRKKRQEKIYSIEELTCKYCGRKFSRVGDKKQHEIQCHKNPNSSRKELICQYCGKICNGNNSHKLHEQKCHFNPKNNKYVNYSTEELCKIISKFKSVTEIYKAGYKGVIEVLEFRNEMPNNYKNRPLRNIPLNELIDKVISFKTKTEAAKAGFAKEIAELIYRNALPEKFILKIPHLSEYTKMSEEEILKIAKRKFKNKTKEEAFEIDRKLAGYLFKRKHLLWQIFKKDTTFGPKNKEAVHKKILENYPGIELPYFDDEYKKFKTSELTCIYNGKKYYKNSKSLYYAYISFEGNNQGKRNNLLRKQEKLNILTKYDLTKLHWTIILDLIGSDKLPKEFHKLCKYGENTPERKKMIQDLIDTYNIEVEEVDIDETEDNTIDENIGVEVSTIPEEELLNEDIYNEDEVKELEPLKEIKEIADMIDEDDIEVFSTGDKWTHIISKEMSRLWNSVLRDNENHNTNTIDNIKNKLNETLTKFEEYVYNMFLKEYEDVVDFEVS